jgi:GntR family transcriptional regulator / MocR family aminotransferase
MEPLFCGTQKMLITLAGPDPLYKQIYQSLRQKILSGELACGTKMPSSRIFADQLCVSRNIVMIAYDQLIAEGYLETRQGSGTYVAAIPDSFLKSKATPCARRSDLPAAVRLSDYGSRIGFSHPEFPQPGKRKKCKYDFRYGHPATDLLDQRIWRRLIMRRGLTFTQEEMGYSPPEGHAPLRNAIAEYVRVHRGVECNVDQIVIVNGSQQALDLTTRILVNPGDAVVVEEPCYPGTRLSLRAIGADIHSIRVDEKGLMTSEFAKIRTPTRLICVTPSHHYPTGHVMALERRLELISFAKKVGAFILEDDYDSEFRYDARPEKSVQGLDPDGRVIYVGTFSKVIFPALRIGYAVLPKALIKPFVGAKSLSDRHSAVYAQGVLAEFVREGHFDRHLRRVRMQVSERRSALIEALHRAFGDSVRISGESAGVHLLAWFPQISRETLPRCIELAAENDVAVYSVDPCYEKLPKLSGLVMGYASLQASNIAEGVSRLARAINRANPG